MRCLFGMHALVGMPSTGRSPLSGHHHHLCLPVAHHHHHRSSPAQEAIAQLRQCLVVAEGDADWRAALAPELAALTAAHAAADRERSVVHMQGVAPAPAPLPPGKVLVEALPHTTPDYGDTHFL